MAQTPIKEQTLKDVFQAWISGKLSREESDKFKQSVAIGKYDNMAATEGLTNALEKAKSNIRAQSTSIATGETGKLGAGDLSTKAREEYTPPTLGEKVKDVVVDTALKPVTLPFEATNTAVKTATEGVKDIAVGMADQAGELVGIDKEKNMVGEGFQQAAEGVFKVLSSPVVGVLSNIKGGDAILKALSSPVTGAGALWEAGWKAAGKDVTDPAFQEGKKQFETAVGTALIPLTDAAVKGVTSTVKGANIGYGTKQYLPEVAATAEKAGVEMPLSSLTSSKAIQGLEALQSKGLFGGKIVETFQNATSKLTEMTDQVVASITPEAISKIDWGNLAKGGFEKFQDVFKTTKETLYEQAKIPKSIKATADNTIGVLKDVLGVKNKSLIPAGGVELFQSFYDNLKGKAQTKGATKITSYDTLKATRSEIGNLLKSNDVIATGNQGALNRLYAAISKDMDAMVSASSPELASAIKTANDYFSKTINEINSKLGSKISEIPAEQLYDKFVKPKNVTELNALREIIGEDAYTEISAIFLKDTIAKATKNEIFSPKTFKSIIERFDTETLNAILSPEQINKLSDVFANLGDIEKLTEAMKSGAKIGAGSPTAFLTALDRLKSVVMGGAGVALSTSLPGLLGGLAAYLLGDSALSKFISSEAGKTFFTTGWDIGKKTGEFIEKTPLKEEVIKTGLNNQED